jgi:hypothetical protein
MSILKFNGIREAWSHVDKIFQGWDPFLPSAHTNFPVRAVLYPTDGYDLRKDQFEAVKYAARHVGDTCFGMAQLEARDVDDLVDSWQWKAPLTTTYEQYISIGTPGLEQCIFSINAHWGLIISHESHALLACMEEFWLAFSEKYSIETDTQEFIKFWSQYDEKPWFEAFINHLTEGQ